MISVSKGSVMIFKTLRRDNSQKGMALILAIGFLAILSILGAVVLSVSLRDLDEKQYTRSYTRADQEALYTADRAIEYGMNRDLVINLAQYNSVNFMTDKVKLGNGTEVDILHHEVIDSTGPGSLVAGMVTDVGPQSLPPAMASKHGTEFGANMYHVSVKSEAGSGLFKKNTHVDASIIRLFKMDDDQIFRTSGGG